MSLGLTLALMAMTGSALGFTLWRERRPAEPFKPKLVPWLFLSMTLLTILLVLTAHAVAELTGVQIKGRFGS